MFVLIPFLIACVLPGPATAQRQTVGRVLIVDPSGNGDAQTVQEALDLLANTAADMRLIVLRSGTYSEKVFITKSNVALVGEDRTSTILRYPILRSLWVSDHGDDWGAAVVSIGKDASDIILANMTVENTYGDSTGDRGHQFTIRGFDATRISLLYCTVRSAGGDALSLWNRDSGMYYHAYCSFEGWVDYVCPRGWCYITNSSFFGHNMSASIWHDGSGQPSQKFVIRYSTFDGRPGFPLGRHHRDAQFYLLDCSFSENMADTPIYAPDSPNTVPWQWGERHYFWNCRREGTNFTWYANNLAEAEGDPGPSEITPAWTFGNRWDPERTLPSVLPEASIPSPSSGASDTDPNGTVLAWIPARGASVESVEFGTDPDRMNAVPVSGSSYSPGTLKRGTQYFWRIRSTLAGSIAQSDIWTFTTRP